MVAGRLAGRAGWGGPRQGGRQGEPSEASDGPASTARCRHDATLAIRCREPARGRRLPCIQRRPSHSLRRNKGDSCRSRGGRSCRGGRGGGPGAGGGSEHVFASEKWPMPRGRRRRLSHTRRISHNCKYHSIRRESATDAARKTNGLSPPRPRRRRAPATPPQPNREGSKGIKRI